MTTIGALIGLMLSVFLIIKKIAPAYSLIAGAIVGGLLGGLPLVETVKMMTEGVKDVTPAIIRILTAGVLSGVLIKTGAAATLSNAIISSLGEKRVFGALALATMLLCAVGVFIDVAVITVAPVALSIGKRLGLSPSVLLVAMIGGGKCGNIISPNPNTIIAADNFGADLSSVMLANLLPAFLGLLFTVFVIVRFIPVTVTMHSAVVYASVSLGVKRTSMRFSPGRTTLPPPLCFKRNEPGTTSPVPSAFASPPWRASSMYSLPTYPSAGSVGGVVMTVLVSCKSSP